jgi:hypothetical protein
MSLQSLLEATSVVKDLHSNTDVKTTSDAISLKIAEVATNIKSVAESQKSTAESIASLTAINNVAMMSIKNIDRDVQKTTQLEANKQPTQIPTTVGSVDRKHEFSTKLGGDTNKVGTMSSMTSDDFINMLVDKLGGLEIRITDMPGSSSTSPLYTIGGGTP